MYPIFSIPYSPFLILYNLFFIIYSSSPILLSLSSAIFSSLIFIPIFYPLFSSLHSISGLISHSLYSTVWLLSLLLLSSVLYLLPLFSYVLRPPSFILCYLYWIYNTISLRSVPYHQSLISYPLLIILFPMPIIFFPQYFICYSISLLTITNSYTLLFLAYPLSLFSVFSLLSDILCIVYHLSPILYTVSSIRNLPYHILYPLWTIFYSL